MINPGAAKAAAGNRFWEAFTAPAIQAPLTSQHVTLRQKHRVWRQHFSNILIHQTMIQLIIALWLALAPAHHNTNPTHGNGTQVTTQDDTGGETEPIPPPPPHQP